MDNLSELNIDSTPIPPSPLCDLFVIGPDELNLHKLQTIENDYSVNIIPLLEKEEVESYEDYDVDAVLDKAERQLHAHPEPVGGIIGFWDFPVSLMIPILSQRLSLPAPSLEAVISCEHKYLSRLLQREVAPEHVPSFQQLDPFDDEAIANIEIPYPFWIKPVKAFSSHLGFRVGNRRDLNRAIAEIRAGIAEIGNAFNDIIEHAELPEEIRRIGGNHCVIEALIGGQQCTVEGFAAHGEVTAYGVVDSRRYPNRVSFSRYQYPSTLPIHVQQRMLDLTAKLISHIGLDFSAFNIEFFWDEKQDHIWILEINPRISQSHGDLFEKVDGTPHHLVAVDLALGRKPRWVVGEGEFACAAKVFLRRFSDATVIRVPTADEIAAVQQRFPGTIINILVEEGTQLSELDPKDQDSYSFFYATLFVGAGSPGKLRSNLRAIRRALPFEFRDV